jgi:hypothetical protein
MIITEAAKSLLHATAKRTLAARMALLHDIAIAKQCGCTLDDVNVIGLTPSSQQDLVAISPGK